MKICKYTLDSLLLFASTIISFSIIYFTARKRARERETESQKKQTLNIKTNLRCERARYKLTAKRLSTLSF